MMRREPLGRKNKRILVFTLAYLALFTAIAVARRNFEFLYYIVLMVGLVLFVVGYHRRLHLSNFVLAALSLVGLLHVMGGNIHFAETRLYETYLLGKVIRYDNVVHSFGILVMTLVLYSALVPHLDRGVRGSSTVLSVVLVVMAMGVGAFIEIVEFGAVAFLGAGEQVGDYWNNSLDLVFNLIGSLVGVALLTRHRRREQRLATREGWSHAADAEPSLAGRDKAVEESSS